MDQGVNESSDMAYYASRLKILAKNKGRKSGNDGARFEFYGR